MRVLKWIVERCARPAATRSRRRWASCPRYEDLDWTGLDFTAEQFGTVMSLDATQWHRELAEHDALFAKVGAKLPRALADERMKLARRLLGQASA